MHEKCIPLNPLKKKKRVFLGVNVQDALGIVERCLHCTAAFWLVSLWHRLVCFSAF